jgi:hypothetical protein
VEPAEGPENPPAPSRSVVEDRVVLGVLGAGVEEVAVDGALEARLGDSAAALGCVEVVVVFERVRVVAVLGCACVPAVAGNRLLPAVNGSDASPIR